LRRSREVSWFIMPTHTPIGVFPTSRPRANIPLWRVFRILRNTSGSSKQGEKANEH
jgi:hypothetical protein